MRRCSAALLAVAGLLLAGCGAEGGASTEPVRPVVVPPLVTSTPVLPVIDAAMKARLQAILERGRARGNRDFVFAKVGDSNTAIVDFLVPIGCGDVRYGPWEDELRPIVERWSAVPVVAGYEEKDCDRSNSFTRVGAAAFPGWRTGDLLRGHHPRADMCRPPEDAAVRCELSQIRPSVALVMVGTNDMLLDDQTIDPSGLEHFRPRLRRLLDEILARDVVPVVSTLPPRRHPGPHTEYLPPLWNEAIIEIAAEYGLPVWNYFLDLQDVPQFGMSFDWLHPSPAPTGAGDLRDGAMRWGFNVRNLGALRVLEKLTRIVIDDGPPDA